MNPDILDTLLIAAIAIVGGTGLIFIGVLIQWSLRKAQPSPPYLPEALTEPVRVVAPRPESIEAKQPPSSDIRRTSASAYLRLRHLHPKRRRDRRGSASGFEKLAKVFSHKSGPRSAAPQS